MESRSTRYRQSFSFACSASWRASRLVTGAIVALQVLGAVAVAIQLATLAQIVNRIDAGDLTGTSEILPLLVLFGVALAFTALVVVFTREFRTLIVERVSLRTTEEMLEVVGAQSFATIESAEFHDRLQRARAGSEHRLFQLVWGAISLLSSLLQMVAIAAVLITIAPIALLVAVLAGVPLVIAARINTRAIYKHAFDLTTDDRRRTWLEQVLLDRRAGAELEVSQARKFLLDAVQRLRTERERRTEGLVRTRLLVSGGSAVVSAVIATAALAVLVNMVANGNLSLSDAAVAVVALQQVRVRTAAVALAGNDLAEAATFSADVREFLDTPLRKSGPNERLRPQRSIALQRVTFSYNGADSPAVNDVSLTLDRGQTLAIVGENGSGKSTLAKLIAGVYFPDLGALLVDGQPLADASVVDAAVVFQDFNRYDLSVAENISIGDTSGEPDRDRIARSAELAGISEKIEALPDGYDTVLAREYVGGTELSGGQWQRVAIARALYAAAPVLILDEPSSALDARSESEMFEALTRDVENRFTIVVSHRFSTVRSADVIIVLHDGELEEMGTHDELMDRGGRYAELFRLQASQYFDD